MERHTRAVNGSSLRVGRRVSLRTSAAWKKSCEKVVDIAGGNWPAKARRAAEGLAASAHGRSPIGAINSKSFSRREVRQ